MHRLVLAVALISLAVGLGTAAQAGGRVSISTSTPGVVLSPVEPAGDKGGIVLTITSSAPGTAFSAVCAVSDNGGQTTEDFGGRAPASLRFEADRVHCELWSEGPLQVLAEGPRGNRSMSSTSGGRIVLSLSY